MLLITAFYSLVFIITSGHVEMRRMLHHADTLNSAFWNIWSDFLARGNLKYIGYAYIITAVAIVVLSFARRQNYDKYQTDILKKGLITAGVALLCLFPIALLLIISEPNYSIETIIFLAVVHWSAALVADLVYVVKQSGT